jgi:hypothetical protein
MTIQEMIAIEPRLQQVVDVVEAELINSTPDNPWLVYVQCKRIMTDLVGWDSMNPLLNNSECYDKWVWYVANHVHDVWDKQDAEEKQDEDDEEEDYPIWD